MDNNELPLDPTENRRLWKKFAEMEEKEGPDWTPMGHMREAVRNRDLYVTELRNKLNLTITNLTKLHELTGILNDINTLSLDHDDDDGYKHVAEGNRLRSILRKIIEE